MEYFGNFFKRSKVEQETQIAHLEKVRVAKDSEFLVELVVEKVRTMI